MRVSKHKFVVRGFGAVLWALSIAVGAEGGPASWQGVVEDTVGKAAVGVELQLRDATPGRTRTTGQDRTATGRTRTATTDAQGAFGFSPLPAGAYVVSARWHGKTLTAKELLRIQPGEHRHSSLQLGASLVIQTVVTAGEQGQASGGEELSSRQVSALPLNKRDFSQLLLLAAGTMTDTNGSANFTQQFSVNGQRGSNSMFAMDGVDTTDPELGGATFSNFNVDAVQEIQSLSGVMPAEFGHGAAGFTNVKTKPGTTLLHGSVFEFVRNADFDARNYFDERTVADPGRIPPFVRNEFGFALGGPLDLPGIYHGGQRTFFFGQYQGFRQVLGTTQQLSVPTAQERLGLDTTAFPGDTLYVPVSPQMAPILAAYPRPNDPEGSYGLRTYATSSKVATDTNQFSVRIDHHLSEQRRLFVRFNLNNVQGPLTNPSQTAIDPTFAIEFHDHQRNAALNYTGAISPHLTAESSAGYIRSTPQFLSPNHTQPAMTFADGLYEPFNAAAGTATGTWGNLFQFRQNFVYLRGRHALKFGAEVRLNHDSSVFGVNPNGTYIFGGGTAYAPEAITSASGLHNIAAGAALPDTLSGFLTAMPFSYNTTVAAPFTATGEHFNEVAIRREAYNFFFQDTWKITPRMELNYGLRYEYDGLIHEANHRTSTLLTLGPDGRPAPYWAAGAHQVIEVNPQPPYQRDWDGFGPRAALEWRVAGSTVLRAGGGITTILPNLWFDNFLTGGFPFMVNPTLTAIPGVPVPFADAVTTLPLPPFYTPTGQLAFPTGGTRSAPPNTPIDIARFQADLAALIPGNEAQPLSAFAMARNFRDGYMENYTAGIEHTFKDVVLSAAYVATAGVRLTSTESPNSYAGASPQFARYSQFNAGGQITGGFSQEFVMATPSHSTYHSLQVSAAKNSGRWGLGLQGSYTLGKALDDVSAVMVGYTPPAAAGTVIQAFYQNPWNPGADKGPSTFDVAQVFTASVIEALPFDRVSWLAPLGKKLTSGWQILNITTLSSGSPFTVYSGIQQTGVGAAGGDRPDEIARPEFSTRRTVREDYFGRGANNPSYFFIPIDVPGGTGPNQGRFGTLGRDTFRGPGFYDLDAALIKDTAFGHRDGSEPALLEFRAEFFNCFNLVNFALPVNILHGTGFGVINHTAGTSRQIQFSLKLIF